MNALLKNEGFVKSEQKAQNQHWECLVDDTDLGTPCNAKGVHLSRFVQHAKDKHKTVERLKEILAAGEQADEDNSPGAKKQKTMDNFVVTKGSSDIKTRSQVMLRAQAWLVSSDQAMLEFENPRFQDFVNAVAEFSNNTNLDCFKLPSRFTVKRLLAHEDSQKSIVALELLNEINLHKTAAASHGLSVGTDGVTVNGTTLQVMVASSSAGHFLLDAHPMGAVTAGEIDLRNLYRRTLSGEHKISSLLHDKAAELQALLTRYCVSFSSDNAKAAVNSILALKQQGIIAFGDPMHAFGRVIVHLVQRVPLFAKSIADQTTIIQAFRNIKLLREGLRLLTPLVMYRFVETRFLFHLIAGQRLVRLWPKMNELCHKEDILAGIQKLPAKQRAVALNAVKLVSSEQVKADVSFLCAVMSPICYCIRTLDRGDRDICLVDPLWRSLVATLSETFNIYTAVNDDTKKAVTRIIIDDWAKYDYPIFGAAFALHPDARHYLRKLKASSIPEERADFASYVSDLRVTLCTFFCRFHFPREEALEQPRERKDEQVIELVEQCMEEFHMMVKEVDEYRDTNGFYSRVGKIHVSDWWDSRTTPGPLKYAAARITSITPGTGPTEKAHKERKLAHSAAMNRRTLAFVSDLVRTKMSLRRSKAKEKSAVAQLRVQMNGLFGDLLKIATSSEGDEALIRFALAMDNIKRHAAHEAMTTTTILAEKNDELDLPPVTELNQEAVDLLLDKVKVEDLETTVASEIRAEEESDAEVDEDDPQDDAQPPQQVEESESDADEIEAEEEVEAVPANQRKVTRSGRMVRSPANLNKYYVG
jgi:hypothetical protein